MSRGLASCSSRAATLVGVGGLVVLALVVVATPASALQEISFDLECPLEDRKVKPMSTPAVWDCTADMYYSSGSTGLTDPVQPAIIALEFQDPPPWVDGVVSKPEIVTYGPEKGTERLEIPVQVAVRAGPQAPAFTPAQLIIEPTVLQHPRSESELSRVTVTDAAHLSLTPDYMSSYAVRMHALQDTVRPQEPLRYEIEIDNYSNGVTRFTFDVRGELPDGFTPRLPEPVVVPGASAQKVVGNDTDQDGPGTATVTFSVQTPYRNGYIDQRVPIQVQVNSAYALDTSVEGESAVVTAIGHAQGAYVPGPGALAATVAACATALLARRRR